MKTKHRVDVVSLSQSQVSLQLGKDHSDRGGHSTCFTFSFYAHQTIQRATVPHTGAAFPRETNNPRRNSEHFGPAALNDSIAQVLTAFDFTHHRLKKEKNNLKSTLQVCRFVSQISNYSSSVVKVPAVARKNVDEQYPHFFSLTSK